MTNFRLESRRGATTMELVISAGLLTALIGTIASLLPRIARIWHESRRHHLVTTELTNHLELLTSVTDAEFDSAIDALEISQELKRVLPDAAITSFLANDKFGKRITLQIDWERAPGTKPIVMVGWRPGQQESDLSKAAPNPLERQSEDSL